MPSCFTIQNQDYLNTILFWTILIRTFPDFGSPLYTFFPLHSLTFRFVHQVVFCKLLLRILNKTLCPLLSRGLHILILKHTLIRMSLFSCLYLWLFFKLLFFIYFSVCYSTVVFTPFFALFVSVCLLHISTTFLYFFLSHACVLLIASCFFIVYSVFQGGVRQKCKNSKLFTKY